jgi:hypothetical protein
VATHAICCYWSTLSAFIAAVQHTGLKGDFSPTLPRDMTGRFPKNASLCWYFSEYIPIYSKDKDDSLGAFEIHSLTIAGPVLFKLKKELYYF